MNQLQKFSSCSTSNLNYGAGYPTQNVIKKVQFVEYPCLTSPSMDQNVPLIFRIDKTNQLTDLNQVYLQFVVKVVKGDGSDLADTDVVSTVNNFGYSVFSDIDVYIQDQRVSTGQGHYPYLAYMKMLLQTTDQEKKFYLRDALWRRDQPGLMDRIGRDEAGVGNEGFTQRAAYIASSSEMKMFIKVSFDFSIDQLIPDQTEIMVRFHRSKASTVLLAEEGDYKIKVLRAQLLVSKVELTSVGERVLHGTLAARSGLVYPAVKSSLITKMLGKGDQNCDWSAISGPIPDRIFIFQTLNSAYNGDISKNIFNFQFFDLQRIQVCCNGESIPAAQAIEISSTSAEMLYMLSVNAINRPDTISFNSWEFRYGYMIACFDLTQDASAGHRTDYLNAPRNGTVRICIDYAKPLAQSITLYCLYETRTELVIDKNRNPAWKESDHKSD